MSQVSLPEYWAEIALGEINHYKSKNVQPKDHPNEPFELWSVPIFPTGKPEVLSGNEIGSSKQAVEVGDVLISKINPRINRVWKVAKKDSYRQIASSEWIVFRQPLMNPQFFLRFFQSGQFRSKLCADVTGVGGSLTRAQPKKVATFPVVVPPFAEQKVIADKLDTLLAQVDNTKARLERIPQILKRFRQSVLAAAVSGRLTKDYREQTIYEEAIDYSLLAKEERKHRGIRETKHASQAECEEKPFEIPGSWVWRRLGNLALKITDGAHNTPKMMDSGHPYVMAKDLTGGGLDFSEKRYISEKDHRELYRKCSPEQGDLLVVNIGAGTGNNVLVNVDFEFSFKNIAIVKRPSFIIAKYLKFFFDSQKQRIFDEQTRGGAQPFLSLTVLNDIAFALPPLKEQTEIVRRVDQLFAHADLIEQQVNNALTRVNNLTQSILAKAFRGELTEQWRKDNPVLISGENSAEALLKSIRDEIKSDKYFVKS